MIQRNTKKLELAFTLHQQGQLDQAEVLYKKILQSQPQHFDALRLLATLARQRKNLIAAVELFDRALKVNPNHSTILISRGNALLELNRPDLALESYEHALAIKPDNAEVFNNRGIALFELKRPEQALDSYDRAIGFKPDYAEALYNRGNTLVELKRPVQALESFDQALTINPDYPEALNNRGITLVELKQLEQALDSYDRALTIKPNYAEALYNRGAALTELSRPEQALESYDRALMIKPDYAKALNNRGIILVELKRPELALDSYNRALAIKPDYEEALNNRGTALAELNCHEQALESYDRALTINPHYAEGLNNRGAALAKLNHPEQALESYDRALTIKPDFAAALNNRGTALVDLNRPEQALESYDRALAIKPDYAEVLCNRGNALVKLKRPEQALASYDQALAIKPDYPEALNKRGITLMELDRLNEAKDCFRAALKIKPDFIQGRYSLSLVSKEGEDNENLLALIAIKNAALNGSAPLVNEDAVLLNFALGKYYNDAGNYETAFPCFLEGCKHKRATFDYDPEQMTRYVDAIMQVFDHKTMEKLRGDGHRSSLPIFVVGMPRSGTTMTEQIISSHPDVYGGGELSDLWEITQFDSDGNTFPNNLPLLDRKRLTDLGGEYVAKLQGYSPDARRITDKMPSNFFAIGLIHLMLPNAKIIHVNRNPLDTCLSCLTTLFHYEHKHTYDLAELGRYYFDYARLMAHWHKLLPSGAFLDVNYEDIVTNQEVQSRRIIEFCGLEWNTACIGFHKNKRQINTASVMQVRQPIYKSSIERWRSYEKFLGPLFDALGEYSRQAEWPKRSPTAI